MTDCIDTFEEESTGYITLAFTDEDGTAVTPASATYTLYDEITESIINSRNATSISGLDTSVDLELEPDDNVIVTTGKNEETHILFVQWVYNTDKVGHDEFRFAVSNLTKVT